MKKGVAGTGIDTVVFTGYLLHIVPVSLTLFFYLRPNFYEIASYLKGLHYIISE